MHFSSSKKIGEVAENACLLFLTSQKIECKKIEGKFEYYDIEATFNDKIIYFEVKNDNLACKTQNVAIEYYNTRSCKDSGISITKAHYYYISTCCEDFIVRVEDLRREQGREVMGGDDKSAKIKLIKLERIRELSRKTIQKC